MEDLVSVRKVCNKQFITLVIVKYGVISLVLSTRLRLVTILSLLVKYLVIFHADPCIKSFSYIIMFVDEKKILNRTLEIDSPFQTFTVGLSSNL